MPSAAQLPLPDELVARTPGVSRYEGREIAIGLRPEHLRPDSGGRAAFLPGTVVVVESLGPEVLAHIEVGARQVLSEDVLEGTVGEEERDALVGVGGGADRSIVIGRFDPETRLAPGDRIELGIDTAKMHVFDLETGLIVHG